MFGQLRKKLKRIIQKHTKVETVFEILASYTVLFFYAYQAMYL